MSGSSTSSSSTSSSDCTLCTIFQSECNHVSAIIPTLWRCSFFVEVSGHWRRTSSSSEPSGDTTPRTTEEADLEQVFGAMCEARKVELVFIGIGMSKEGILRLLRECVYTRAEAENAISMRDVSMLRSSDHHPMDSLTKLHHVGQASIVHSMQDKISSYLNWSRPEIALWSYP